MVSSLIHAMGSESENIQKPFVFVEGGDRDNYDVVVKCLMSIYSEKE